MENESLNAAIDSLHLADHDRKEIAELLKAPTRRVLWTAAFYVLLSAMPLFIGFDAMALSFSDPNLAAPHSGRDAVALARGVGFFYFGVMWLIIAGAMVLSFYRDQHRYRRIRLLISRFREETKLWD